MKRSEWVLYSSPRTTGRPSVGISKTPVLLVGLFLAGVDCPDCPDCPVPVSMKNMNLHFRTLGVFQYIECTLKTHES